MKKQNVLNQCKPVTLMAACAVFLLSMGASSSAWAEVTFTPITEGPAAEGTARYKSASWGDYDNDGLLDLVVTRREDGSFCDLYHTNSDGTLTEVTGVFDYPVSNPIGGVLWGDPDNDGDLDLFVTTFDDAVDVFFRNNGDAIFARETDGAWVNTSDSSYNQYWGDYDNDGYVDLYVAVDGNENFLYHNDGDGMMTPVTTAANSNLGESHGGVWTDYDGDGDIDLFVTGQQKVQFRNDGDGDFTWISPENGGLPSNVGGVDADALFNSADYDNDGDMDLVRTVWADDSSALLYRNDGESGFTDVTSVLPSVSNIDAMGAAWGDYDNDGHQDLFISNNRGNNLLYHNEGDGSFTRITESPAVSQSRNSSSSMWVDYDNDGDLDLFVANGMFSGTAQSCEFYRNDGGTQNWVGLNLYGILSNRSALGAKVRATATIDGEEVTLLREIKTGQTSVSGMRVNFGLGDATMVDTLRIEWPSGEVQEMRDVAANQYVSVDEMGMGAKLANISTRGQVGTGDNVLIAGLVVTGVTPRQVLIRASGATLADFGVTDVLTDTVLTLIDADDVEIATNTNWMDADNATAIAAAAVKVGAFDFPADSTDSAILITLDPGAYTAQVSGNSEATGNALVEVYSMD